MVIDPSVALAWFTLYDAAYLKLAQRRGAALVTFDAALAKAAAKEGVPVPPRV